MCMGAQFAGMVFKDILEHVSETVIINKDGFGTFSVLDGSMSIWVPTGEIVEIPEEEEEEVEEKTSEEPEQENTITDKDKVSDTKE